MGRQEWKHRGLALDVSRHYMPVKDVHRLLRAAARCGVNRMHWHLGDDQGWRVEIVRWPKLTEVGGRRAPDGHGNGDGWYTQDEIRETVAFAKELGIEIIPEIEIPGHATAMLAAYPEFACRRSVYRDGREQIVERPYDYTVTSSQGIFPNLVCAGREDSIRFLLDIVDEVAELFPFPAFHIGGDEALKQHWRRCPDCQARMRSENLPDEEALQRWLMMRIGAHLAGKGKDVIVYNEALAGGPLPEHFIVQHWLGNDVETERFLKSGGRVIWSDVDWFYHDYPYTQTGVKKLYDMPGIPPYCAGYEDQVLGFECMMWTERVPDLARAARLLFPRLPAVMLRLEDDPACRSWDAFTARLRQLRRMPDMLGELWAPEDEWLEPGEDGYISDWMSSEAWRAAMEKVRGRLRLEELEKLLCRADMPRPAALSIMDCAARDMADYAATPGSDALPGVGELTRRLLSALDARGEGADPEGQELLDKLRRCAWLTRKNHEAKGDWAIDCAAFDD